jgi:hypothetical protein
MLTLVNDITCLARGLNIVRLRRYTIAPIHDRADARSRRYTIAPMYTLIRILNAASVVHYGRAHITIEFTQRRARPRSGSCKSRRSFNRQTIPRSARAACSGRFFGQRVPPSLLARALARSWRLPRPYRDYKSRTPHGERAGPSLPPRRSRRPYDPMDLCPRVLYRRPNSAKVRFLSNEG